MMKPKTPTDTNVQASTATAHLLPNTQSPVKKSPLTFFKKTVSLNLHQTSGRVTSIAHSPVLEGSRRVEGRCILSTCAVSLLMETSQPCRAGPSPAILELGLRTLLMARKEAAYRGLGVEGGWDQELKAGLSLLSHLFGTYLRKQPSVNGDFYLHTSSRCLR